MKINEPENSNNEGGEGLGVCSDYIENNRGDTLLSLMGG